ncbi:MAG: ATP-dependent Clp protease proteolytic subunit [Bacteroidales bacterium]|nr:ATP-dependent Clp protease proteolytic subunit [Bacteroidales bacterium]
MAINHTFFNVKENTGERAVIDIDGTIGGWDWDSWERINTGKLIRKALRDLKGVKEIEVRITSLGGDVDQALQIHDALQDHPAKVITIINGFCASAATIIALAGDVRRISRNAVYLTHKCSSYVGGNQHDLEMELERQKTVNEVLLDMYRAVNKKTEQELLDLFEYDNGHGKWITAQEVVDFGFCTEIYNNDTGNPASLANKPMVNMADFKRLEYPAFPSDFAHVEYRENNLPVEVPGDTEPNNEETLMNKIITRARELFAPRMDVTPDNSINQNKEEMKKFNILFPLLALCLVGFANQDYDPEKGVSLTDQDMKDVEAKMKELSDAKTALEQAKATLEQEKAALEQDKANLQQSVTTLTAERDNYKAKYENKPADVPAVNGKDAKLDEQSFEDYVKNNPVYQQTFEENL